MRSENPYPFHVHTTLAFLFEVFNVQLSDLVPSERHGLVEVSVQVGYVLKELKRNSQVKRREESDLHEKEKLKLAK